MVQTSILTGGSIPSVHLAPRTNRASFVRRWALLELAATGSLARVFHAKPAGASSDQAAAYAVKMLRTELQNDDVAIELLQREALVGQSVADPHLVPILSAHVLESPRMLIMPWLEGATLQQRFDAGQRFAPLRTVWIARQAAEGLAALYEAGWMHGDVTPGNISLSPTGHVTLLDFSFARRPDEGGSAANRPIMGTCQYLAPETLTSALRPDSRSDIYSLGAVMFQMLSGQVPYPAKDLADLATQHQQAAPLDLSRLVPEVPREVIALVRQMTAREPLRRPQTPRELIDRLMALEIGLFSLRTDG